MATVGHYDLIEKLGEGGMGVVWKARDTRLERLVAIKFLPPEKTADPDRKRRFAQEARAASALNHPRIITIYDIDHADGADYIVMEYVPGKTLDQLIPPKGMKLADAIRYAMQIADALAAAHAAGIVHRDLKPANVIVSDNGQLKVLDFGLAKLQEVAPTQVEDATRTLHELAKTDEGTIVGTTSYMSPEQAEGRKVDARSDIFSFGAVVYEMLTGRRAFRGDTKMSTLAAILRSEPEPVEKVADGLPRDLARIVQRCLRKDPAERAQSMADLRLALKELKDESESGLLNAPTAPAARARKPLWIAAGVAALAAAGVAGYLLSTGKSAPETPLKATVLTSFPGMESNPSFSPDGSQVAFAWNGDHQDNYDIYVTLLGTGKPLRLTTDPALDRSPAWSPDGRWIAFIRGSSLLAIPPIGGTEREVAQGIFASAGLVSTRPTLSWFPDSRWLVAGLAENSAEPRALFIVSFETGERRRLTTPAKGFQGDYFASVSPDGRAVAFARILNAGSIAMMDSDIYVLSLRADHSPDGEPRRLTSEHAGVEGLAWTADGRDLVFSSMMSGAPGLWRIPVSGAQKPVKLSVGDDGIYPDISRPGNRLVFEKNVPSDLNIWRIDLTDPAHASTVWIASSRSESQAKYSPDGRRITFQSDRSGRTEVWVCDADGGNPVPLTTSLRASGSPAWSPDGQRIAFDSVVEGRWQVFTISARGGSAQALTSGMVTHTRPSWSHDGKWIYASGGEGVLKIPAAGGPPVQLSRTRGDTNPQESVDGRTLYFNKDDTIWQVGTDGGGERQAIDGPASTMGLGVTADGIYYFTPPTDRALRFYSFATGKSREIRKIDKATNLGMSVSPDGKWLIHSQVDAPGTGDLMLVDPFR